MLEETKNDGRKIVQTVKQDEKLDNNNNGNNSDKVSETGSCKSSSSSELNYQSSSAESLGRNESDNEKRSKKIIHRKKSQSHSNSSSSRSRSSSISSLQIESRKKIEFRKPIHREFQNFRKDRFNYDGNNGVGGDRRRFNDGYRPRFNRDEFGREESRFFRPNHRLPSSQRDNFSPEKNIKMNREDYKLKFCESDNKKINNAKNVLKPSYIKNSAKESTQSFLAMLEEKRRLQKQQIFKTTILKPAEPRKLSVNFPTFVNTFNSLNSSHGDQTDKNSETSIQGDKASNLFLSDSDANQEKNKVLEEGEIPSENESTKKIRTDNTPEKTEKILKKDSLVDDSSSNEDSSDSSKNRKKSTKKRKKKSTKKEAKKKKHRKAVLPESSSASTRSSSSESSASSDSSSDSESSSESSSKSSSSNLSSTSTSVSSDESSHKKRKKNKKKSSKSKHRKVAKKKESKKQSKSKNKKSKKKNKKAKVKKHKAKSKSADSSQDEPEVSQKIKKDSSQSSEKVSTPSHRYLSEQFIMKTRTEPVIEFSINPKYFNEFDGLFYSSLNKPKISIKSEYDKFIDELHDSTSSQKTETKSHATPNYLNDQTSAPIQKLPFIGKMRGLSDRIVKRNAVKVAGHPATEPIKLNMNYDYQYYYDYYAANYSFLDDKNDQHMSASYNAYYQMMNCYDYDQSQLSQWVASQGFNLLETNKYQDYDNPNENQSNSISIENELKNNEKLIKKEDENEEKNIENNDDNGKVNRINVVLTNSISSSISSDFLIHPRSSFSNGLGVGGESSEANFDSPPLSPPPIRPKMTFLEATEPVTLPNGVTLPPGTKQIIVHPYNRPIY